MFTLLQVETGRGADAEGRSAGGMLLLCCSPSAAGSFAGGRRLPPAGAGRSRVAVERSKEGRVGPRGSAGEVLFVRLIS